MEENPSKTLAGPGALRPTGLRSAVRSATLAGATLTTGLQAGLFYAYAVSVNLALADQPDDSYVATMNAINGRILNPTFFASFYGAPLFLIAALAAHSPRPHSGRFWLVALACALHIGGDSLVTIFANVPLNNQLAGVAADASAGELAGARTDFEGPWNLWNGVRTVSSVLAFATLVGACLMREGRGSRPGRRPR